MTAEQRIDTAQYSSVAVYMRLQKNKKKTKLKHKVGEIRPTYIYIKKEVVLFGDVLSIVKVFLSLAFPFGTSWHYDKVCLSLCQLHPYVSLFKLPCPHVSSPLSAYEIIYIQWWLRARSLCFTS